MKNIFTAIILSFAFAGLSFAQGSGATRIAVVEFTPGPNAAPMTVEDKRQLQASIAYSLVSTRKFSVVDVRNTREASKSDLTAINGTSTGAAVKLGKQLGVAYVLTGTIAEYGKTGIGHVTLKTRLVEVATGKVKYSGEISQQSTTPMSARAATGEMMLKLMRPAIEKLTARLTGV